MEIEGSDIQEYVLQKFNAKGVGNCLGLIENALNVNIQPVNPTMKFTSKGISKSIDYNKLPFARSEKLASGATIHNVIAPVNQLYSFPYPNGLYLRGNTIGTSCSRKMVFENFINNTENSQEYAVFHAIYEIIFDKKPNVMEKTIEEGEGNYIEVNGFFIHKNIESIILTMKDITLVISIKLYNQDSIKHSDPETIQFDLSQALWNRSMFNILNSPDRTKVYSVLWYIKYSGEQLIANEVIDPNHWEFMIISNEKSNGHFLKLFQISRDLLMYSKLPDPLKPDHWMCKDNNYTCSYFHNCHSPEQFVSSFRQINNEPKTKPLIDMDQFQAKKKTTTQSHENIVENRYYNQLISEKTDIRSAIERRKNKKSKSNKVPQTIPKTHTTKKNSEGPSPFEILVIGLVVALFIIFIFG